MFIIPVIFQKFIFFFLAFIQHPHFQTKIVIEFLNEYQILNLTI